MSDRDVLLSLNELSVAFKTKKGMAQAVRGVTFDVHRGESLAVVGGSVCARTSLTTMPGDVVPAVDGDPWIAELLCQA